MTGFDFADWLSRARAFTIRVGSVPNVEVRSTIVAAPMREFEIHAVERALGAALPAALRALFTRGAAAVDCAYAFEPQGEALEHLRALLPDEDRVFGGARFGPASDLPEYRAAAREWARDTWIADDLDQRTMWESALPFVRLDNGDYLALDCRADHDDPPVVYLSHDDESFLLAADLVTFLTAWEHVCYLGPEEWLLRPFTDPTGRLDAESERAARLRQLLH